MTTQLKILIHELKLHRDEICSLNKSPGAGKKQPFVIQYIKLVRVFLKSEDYKEVVEECISMNEQLDGKNSYFPWVLLPVQIHRFRKTWSPSK